VEFELIAGKLLIQKLRLFNFRKKTLEISFQTMTTSGTNSSSSSRSSTKGCQSERRGKFRSSKQLLFVSFTLQYQFSRVLLAM
jgi:hypothetical protein